MTNGRRILIVSGGDSGRSMMAKAIFDKKVKESETMDMDIIARGFVVLFPEPISEKIQIVLQEHGAKLDDECMRQLTQEDINATELIICMTDEIKEKVLEEYENIEKIACIKDLGGEEGELLDPYGKELMDYEYSYREMDRLVDKILDRYSDDDE